MAFAQQASSTGTSHSLISGLRRRDAVAWEHLVRLYSPLVIHWLRRWNVPTGDVPDLSQEVFRAVAHGVDGFRKERKEDSFRGWLRQITLNKVRDFSRQTAHLPQAAGGTDALVRLHGLPAEVPADDEDDPVWSAVLQRAFDVVRPDIHEKTWAAFWRTVVDGQTAAETGQELSLTAAAVRVAKCRVLQRLREVLGDSND